MSRRALVPSLVLVLLVALGAAIASGAVRPAAEHLAAHVAALSAPAMEGRGSATAGGDLAARYLADRLAALGFAPGGDGGTFFQSFAVGVAARTGAGTALEPLGANAAAIDLGSEWVPHGGSLTGEVTGEIVVVGHRAASPGGAVDDYGGLDVRGKIALALDGAEPARPGSRLERLIAARHRGAAALLLIGDTLPPIETTAAPVKIHSGAITRAAADRLLAPGGRTLTALASGAPVATAVKARLRVSFDREERRAANVVGILRGSDPALASEAVVLGAHYDHLGRVSGAVHPGADDNASGTAVVLGLAEAFAAAGGTPRTLVFAFFSGEEIGLLGSAHYTRHPAVPIDRTVAMLNFDMVGRMRNERLHVGGVESGAGLRALVTAAAGGTKVDLSLKDEPFGPSDHTSFYSAGVPVLFFHTGSHDDYHRPGDTADKINAAGMAEVARIGGYVAEQLGHSPRPAYVKLSPSARGPRASGAAGGAFLGVAVDGRTGSDGVTLGSVVADSAAARAGLRGGDVIVRLDDRPLASFEDLRQAIAGKRPGDTVTLLYLRDGEDRTASAILGTR